MEMVLAGKNLPNVPQLKMCMFILVSIDIAATPITNEYEYEHVRMTIIKRRRNPLSLLE